MKRSLIKKLDNLWSLAVKEKAKWKCEHCGRYDSRMEAAHVVGRRHRATRWGYAGNPTIEANDLCGHCLCHVCHQEYDEHGPIEKEIIERTIGGERLLNLQRIATEQVAKWQEYEEIKELLEKERAASDDSPYANSP